MNTEYKREHGRGLPTSSVMACSNHKLFKRVTSNPYTPPAGATTEGIRRAEQLQFVRIQDKKLADGSCPPSLERYCKVFDKRPSRRYKNQTNGEGKGLRNAEFLIALILKNEGHATSIPPDWWIVKGKSPAKRKSPEVSPGPEVYPVDEDIDLDDPERYGMHCTPAVLQLVQCCKYGLVSSKTNDVLQCSLPDDWKDLLKV